MTRRVLVTGASGFVGAGLCKELKIRETWDFFAAVRRSTAEHHVAVGEINGQTEWHSALANCEVVVHLAGLAHKALGPGGTQEMRVVNVDGTVNLARQAAACGVRRFVFLSTIKACAERSLPGKPVSELQSCRPEDAYGQSKIAAEMALQEVARETGMEFVIIRSPLVYGPGVKANFATLLRAVRNGWLLPLGRVNNQRSFIAIDNLVDFIITCATHPKAANQTFHISDGSDLSTPELVAGIARMANVKVHLWPVPVGLLRAAAYLLGKSDAAQRLTGNLQVDISKARTVLDWVPPLSVEQGLRRAVAGIEGT